MRLLQAALGLTPTESRLAVALAAGQTRSRGEARVARSATAGAVQGEGSREKTGGPVAGARHGVGGSLVAPPLRTSRVSIAVENVPKSAAPRMATLSPRMK